MGMFQLKALLPPQDVLALMAAGGLRKVLFQTPVRHELLHLGLGRRTAHLRPDSVTAPLDQSLRPGSRCSDVLDHMAIHGTGQPCPDHVT